MSAAGRYAAALLAEAGAEDAPPPLLPEEDPAAAWARSGALALTGRESGPPLLPTAPLPTCAEGALAALRALSPGLPASAPQRQGRGGAALLAERAAAAALRRRGRTAPGGSCRLLPAAAGTGWLAVNLPRGAEDARLLPAWLGCEAAHPWQAIAEALAETPRPIALARARLLGLPAAPADPPEAAAPESAGGARVPEAPRAASVAGGVRGEARMPEAARAGESRAAVGAGDSHWRGRPWLRRLRCGEKAAPRALRGVRVVDLSALWAGPLCGRLLAQAGAQVLKIESAGRPERPAQPAFYAALNACKRRRVLNFGSAQGRAALHRAIGEADVVIESTRPRALAQLGVDAERWIAARPGRTWCSITGYGRAAPQCNWVALGDDAAAAAGLCWCLPPAEAPLFVADAAADPLCGVHAALAICAALRRGGGELLDVPLCAVAARCIRFAAEAPCRGEIIASGGGARLRTAAGEELAIAPPH